MPGRAGQLAQRRGGRGHVWPLRRVSGQGAPQSGLERRHVRHHLHKAATLPRQILLNHRSRIAIRAASSRRYEKEDRLFVQPQLPPGKGLKEFVQRTRAAGSITMASLFMIMTFLRSCMVSVTTSVSRSRLPTLAVQEVHGDHTKVWRARFVRPVPQPPQTHNRRRHRPAASHFRPASGQLPRRRGVIRAQAMRLPQ